MATFGEIHLEEPSTVTAEMRTVVWDIDSSNQQGEVMVIGDPESSVAIARVSSVAPKSTDAAIAVRIAGGPSTAADAVIRVDQGIGNSTAGDAWRVSQASTAWQVQLPSSQSFQVKNSTIGDLQATVQQATTNWVVQLPSSQSFQVKNSTIGDLLASVQQNSTVWQVQQSTGVHGARASTVSRASVTQSSTSVTLQTSNASRMGWTVTNNPNNGASLYVAFGGGAASTSDFDLIVRSGGYYEMPQPVFFGEIRGIWDSTGTGFARTCEWRP